MSLPLRPTVLVCVHSCVRVSLPRDRRYSAAMADFLPVEANKAHILMVRPATQGTSLEDANAEWVEVFVDLSSDLANWRLQHLRGRWREETAKPVEWEWIYTWGSPAFVNAGEVYRIHSGSRVRAATHPVTDDLAPGRKHVYAAGPTGAARLVWRQGGRAGRSGWCARPTPCGGVRPALAGAGRAAERWATPWPSASPPPWPAWMFAILGAPIWTALRGSSAEGIASSRQFGVAIPSP